MLGTLDVHSLIIDTVDVHCLTLMFGTDDVYPMEQTPVLHLHVSILVWLRKNKPSRPRKQKAALLLTITVTWVSHIL